jgi:protoporphyrinogen/coproporphyrinogen III oxidase
VSETRRVAIVGGGIAGLTAAWELRRHGLAVTLLEADTRFGGKLRTERVGDLLIDAGPDSFLSSKPAALQLIDELGLSERVINTRADGGGTYILRAGQLQPLPEGITLLVPADPRAILRTKLLSPLGKLRMAADYVLPARKGDGDESVGAFVRRRLGRQAFERMAEPLLSGIYAGDADELSLLATFPRLRDIERQHGGMLRGAIAQRRQARATPATARRHSPFVSLDAGMSVLVAALVDALDDCDLRVGVAVTSLERCATQYTLTLSDGTFVNADAVVLATPAYVSADLARQLAPALAAALDSIQYVSTATISLAYDAAAVAGRAVGRGFVIPRAEGRTLTAVTWTSQKFAGRAPDGQALLRGFVGRSGSDKHVALPDDELVALVRGELRDILRIDAEPLAARVFRWPRAMPQYAVGHLDRLARIDALTAALPGLMLAGNAYRAVGIPDLIADSRGRAVILAQAIIA